MNKKLFLSTIILCLLHIASVTAGNENILKIHDVEANAGETITIELEILNDDDVIGFNCDIPLPEGFSLVPGSGEHFRTSDHSLSLSVIDDNTARLMLFSGTNAFLTGNDGVVATFDVETPDTPGTYTLDITGIPVIGTIINGNVTNVLTGTESGDVTLKGEEFTLTINVVGEGSVNVDGTPYTEPVIIEEGSEVTLNAIAEDDWRFDEWDGDLTGSATQIEFTMDEDKEIQAIFTEMEQNIMKVRNVTALTDDLAWIELEIINELDFVGFNADIVLPEGFTYVDGSEELLRDVDHLMEFNIIDDNTARMISFSPGVIPYTGNDGVIVRFMVETPEAPGDYPLALENAIIGNEAFDDILTETVDGTITLEEDDEIENILLVRDVTAYAGDIITIEVEIINDQEFAGFNTDVVIPEGFTFIESSDELLRKDDHEMVFNIIEEGTKARMIGFSPGLNPFLGNEGPIVTFELQTPEVSGTHPIPPVDAVIGDVEGDDILTSTQEGTITLLAPHSLTLIANPEEGGTVEDLTDNAPYNVGDLVEIKAEPNEGWEFVNWTGDYADNLANDEAAETTLTMPADDVELTANFEQIEFTVTFTVEDEDGNPIEGAFVNIEEDEFTGLTDENGEVDFIFFMGDYNYEVEVECLLTASGVIEVIDDDLDIVITMVRLMGDANDDGFVNVLDVLAIANYYAQTEPVPDPFCFLNADMNEDDIINVIDLLLVANVFIEKVEHHGLKSDDAHAFLDQGSISLTSDGTLAGIQFEFSGKNLAGLEPSLTLPDHQMVYGHRDDVFRIIIFNINQVPIPEGNIELVTFNKDVDEILTWSDALGGNLNADEVPVHTHTGDATDVEDIMSAIEYNVFPNPAENMFWISLNNPGSDSVSISLLNSQGQVLQTRSVNERGFTEVKFNVSDLPPGMYIIQLDDQTNTFLEKIMLR